MYFKVKIRKDEYSKFDDIIYRKNRPLSIKAFSALYLGNFQKSPKCRVERHSKVFERNTFTLFAFF
jgi:hypothetical protein